tara:strand:- start:641 stop:1219 length:579 start_codon:yes stop_codon:yes gene_type:complete
MEQSDGYVIATAVTEEPLTVSEIKTRLRITGTDQDDYIAALITAARKQAETITWGAFCTQTWDVYFDKFENDLQIWKGPISSITSIKYQDESNVEQTLATASYSKQRSTKSPFRIKILTAPSTYADGLENVVVRFVAGYGAASTVPEIIKQAITVRVGTWYEVRQEIHTGTQVNVIDNWFENMLHGEGHTGL